MKEFFSILFAGLAIGIVGFIGFSRFEQVSVKIKPGTSDVENNGITRTVKILPAIGVVEEQNRQPWCPTVFGCNSKIPTSPCNAPAGTFCV